MLFLSEFATRWQSRRSHTERGKKSFFIFYGRRCYVIQERIISRMFVHAGNAISIIKGNNVTVELLASNTWFSQNKSDGSEGRMPKSKDEIVMRLPRKLLHCKGLLGSYRYRDSTLNSAFCENIFRRIYVINIASGFHENKKCLTICIDFIGLYQ